MAAAPLVAIDVDHPQPRMVERAVVALREGWLVCYPTDTCYAVGCDLASKKAIARLHELKTGHAHKPFALLCEDLSAVSEYGHLSNFAHRTMRRLVPGPYTFVLRATRRVPDLMMTRQKEVGIRIPDAAVAHALAQGLGHPLVTTTANGPEGEPLVDPRDIKEQLGDRLELILDGGIQVSEPSTVVSLLDDHAEVLRLGKGPLDRL